MAAGEPRFSHKQHAPLRLNCAHCHTSAATSARAGFPGVATCRSCHPKMSGDTAIPSRRVYRLADFVVFTHARHASAGIDCARCHGPVSQRDALTAEVDHSMKSCMDCHRQLKATLVCTACHELGQ